MKEMIVELTTKTDASAPIVFEVARDAPTRIVASAHPADTVNS
jgi:hypothetical protein